EVIMNGDTHAIASASAGTEGLLGLKRLHGFLEVTTAQVHN
ncbi:hypothetical protein Tco_0177099, partial [Tanacetum coccineum]